MAGFDPGDEERVATSNRRFPGKDAARPETADRPSNPRRTNRRLFRSARARGAATRRAIRDEGYATADNAMMAKGRNSRPCSASPQSDRPDRGRTLLIRLRSAVRRPKRGVVAGRPPERKNETVEIAPCPAAVGGSFFHRRPCRGRKPGPSFGNAGRRRPRSAVFRRRGFPGRWDRLHVEP